MSARVTPPRPRRPSEAIRAGHRSNALALSKQEAAESLGVSLDTFERHVLPALRVVKVGPPPPEGRRDKRRVIVPVSSLTEWLDAGAHVHGEVER